MHRWKSYIWRYPLIIVIYGTAYAVIRNPSLASASIFSWIPVAALRLSCMLLMPMRYWPALVIGELLPLGYKNYRCLDEQGMLWVVVNSIPPALESMPIVWLVRKHLSSLQVSFVEKTPQLIACITAVATNSALFGWLSYVLLKQHPVNEPNYSFIELTSQAFMGGYLAMLSFTPLALWLNHWFRRESASHVPARVRCLAFVRNGPWRLPSALLLTDAAMALWGHYGSGDAHFWAMAGILATLVPIAGYGWPVMAVAGAGANAALASLTRAYNDAETLHMQVLTLWLLTCAFLYAYRSSMAYERAQEIRKAKMTGRRSQRLDEQQRRMSAEYLGDTLDEARECAAHVIRAKTDGSRSTQELAIQAQQWQRLQEQHKRILMGMVTHQWWDLGNPDGPIVAALLAEGIHFQVIRLPRHAPALELSKEMELMLPRFAREALFRALSVATTDRISLGFSVQLRTQGGWDIEIVAESHGHPKLLSLEGYERLLVTLGVQGLTDFDLNERAQLYDGDMELTQHSAWHARVVVRLADDMLDVVGF